MIKYIETKYNIVPINDKFYKNITICKNKNISTQKYCIKTQSLLKNRLLQKEIDILLSIQHPNIIKIKWWSIHPYIFYIVPYYPKGDLFDLITKTKLKNNYKMIITIFQKIVSIVDDLHSTFKLIHRDIKPENILLTNNYEPIMIDFEYAIRIDNPIMITVCGSPEYASPEMIMGDTYDYKTDYWSLGVLLYVMIFRTYPIGHSNCSFQEMKQLFLQKPFCFVVHKMIPNHLKQILDSLLQFNPKYRQNLKKIKKLCNK